MTLATEPGAALASAALALIDVRFRLHGRDPATGLDCVGVLAAALAAIGRPATLPSTHSVRTREPRDLGAIAASCGLAHARGPAQAGDVAFVRIAATQFHLLIQVDDRRHVHAHAALRRVVVHEGTIAWPIAALWRLNNHIGE